MVTSVRAKVQVTVELDIALENWTDQSSMEQVHREAEEYARRTITDLCARTRAVRLVECPLVQAIIAERKKHG
jgi:hypothetical protein